MSEIGIGILGCGGRMGRMLIAEITQVEGARLVGGVDSSVALVGYDLGSLAGLLPLGLAVEQSAPALAERADVLIDFTVPAATAQHVGIAAAAGKPLVIGTTGLEPEHLAKIDEAARIIPVIAAPNYSLGVNLLLDLVQQAAQRLGPDYDIEILEMHHRQKIDAPSGTALGLGRAAASGRGRKLEDIWVKTRDGITGKRETGTIGFATLRGGDVTGDHTVIFASLGERLELAHKASDRRIFAHGAVRAAVWLVNQKPGLYTMKDVLGLQQE
jgi:4-hydroxy-tetrahydrodipicolinate reductase